MIQGLKPYVDMKDSGIEWLGDVPAHWEVRRLKYLLKERDTRSLEGSEQLLSVSQYTGVTEREPTGAGDLPDTRAASLVGYKRVDPDDLVVNIMLAWNGSMGVSQFSGITSPAYCVYRFRKNSHPWYYHHLLRSPIYRGHIKAVSTGVVESRLRLYTEDLYRLETHVPPLSEQAAIVSFLDHADRLIQSYISTKQRHLSLLEEQKQAIIHQAVTGQIDVRTSKPYPAYKPSGVEWLGDVPEHWEVRRLKSLSIVKRGASPRPIGDSRYFDDNGEYAWVRIGDVTASNNYLEVTTQRLSRLGQSLSVRLQPGELFLSIAGSVGKPIITKIKCCIHDGFVYFPQFSGNAEFLCRVFSCGAPFAKLGKLGTQLNLNTDTVGIICLGWPPESEQEEIADFLVDATEGIDSAITSIEHQIDLLQEYRNRLIADVVTGKLDVREAAGELPEEDVFGDAEKSANEYEIEKDMAV